MRYYRYLYLSEGLKKKKDRIIAKLEKKKFQMDIYLRLFNSKRKQLLFLVRLTNPWPPAPWQSCCAAR